MKHCFPIFAIALLLTALLTVGCVPESLSGLVSEPMDAAVADVLDEETRAFFERYDENPPICMTVYYDQQFPEAIVSDAALMREMRDAFLAIRVTAKTNMASTDGYHSLRFITADGAQYGVGFENSVLIEGNGRYELDNAKAFWGLFRTTAEESWDAAQARAEQFARAPVSYADAALGDLVACTAGPVAFAESADDGWLDASMTLTLENKGSKPLSALAFQLQLLDFDGYVVDEAALTANFSDAPVAPGETREYPVARKVLDLSGGASVGGIMGALVTVEAAEAVPGEALPEQPLFAFYNDPEMTAFAERFKTDPPASVTFRFNWYSAEAETSTDPEVVAAAFEALGAIVVGERVDEYATDSDTAIIFTDEDGREYAFCFNLHNLEIPIAEHPYTANYRVTGSEGLWALIRTLYDR